MNDSKVPQSAVASEQPPQSAEEEGIIVFDQSSDTDVSMSASEDEIGSPRHWNAVTGVISCATMELTAGESASSITDHENVRKRKVSAEESEILGANKKARSGKEGISSSTSSPEDWSHLPKEYWHHIFTFVPPQDLMVLLQVNTYFNAYLDEDSSCFRFVSSAEAMRLESLGPDEIWRTSRKRYCPKMPGPLRGKTELEMWRLLRVGTCEFCGKMPRNNASVGQAKSNLGPGVEGVNMIWPFAIRSCGPCLVTKSTKEIDLLLSSTVPSVLLPALPFVLVTGDLQVFSPSGFARSQGFRDVPLTKFFLSEDLDNIRCKFEYVKSLGTGAAEEWLKGLEERGRKQRLDTDRWEKWESNGGLLQICKPQNSSVLRVLNPQITKSKVVGLPGPRDNCEAVNQSTTDLRQTEFSTYDAPSDIQPPLHPILPLKIDDDEPLSLPQLAIQLNQPGPPQAKRTMQEVLELKASRRAEIERRASLLDPSIPPNVLAQIPSFQAALQIITPLDDHAWEMLKPRLLAQRIDAGQREERNQVGALLSVDQSAGLQECPHTDFVEERAKETKELMDKDWDDAQAPLRGQISMFADEIIHENWDDGIKVSKETCPRFAADVLLQVRQRFYAEVDKEATAVRILGKRPIEDPPQGPFTQKLTLENMKWLFEVKIKPHTETFRKELFLCHGCDDNVKAYGFEGVVQHYAAKHTKSMSLGNIVVYWRSEWPEVPPFHPDPVAKSTRIRNSATAPTQQSVGQYNHGFQPMLVPGSLAPGHSGLTYAGHHSQHGHPFHHGTYGSLGMYSQPQVPYNTLYPQQPIALHPVHGIPPNTAPPPPGLHPVPHYAQQFRNGFSGPLHYSRNYDAHHLNPPASYPMALVGVQSDKMRAQLEALAHSSREIWVAIAGVKDLPGYIRVYVCLHHLAKRYRSQFAESPPLMMFIDGLSNHKEMRPVRNVNGLMCKACHLSLGNFVPVENERTAFSLPQLVNHFQQKHIEPSQSRGGPLLDWTVDMVFLPEVACLPNLKAMVGMDSHKYWLITDAFPQVAFSESLRAQIPHAQIEPHENHTSATIPAEVAGLHAIHSASGLATTQTGGYPNKNSDHQQRQLFGHEPALCSQLQAHSDHPDTNLSLPYSLQASLGVTEQRPSHVRNLLQKSGVPSGRESSEWSAGTQQRKPSRKEHRARVRQEAKVRKGNAKNDVAGKSVAEPAETEEDKEAEVEAQRQEEAIRAMWAADRKATARIATTSATSQSQHTDQNQVPLSPFLGSPVPPQARAQAQSTRSTAVPQCRAESQMSVVETEDDLFAGLESHLAHQRAVRTIGTIASNEEPLPAQAPLVGQKMHSTRYGLPGLDRAHGAERSRSRSPERIQRQGHQSQYRHRYQEHSPRYHEAELAHGTSYQIETAEPLSRSRAETRSYMDDYDRTQLRDHRVCYADEVRSQPISSHQRADMPQSRPLLPLQVADEPLRRSVPSVQYVDSYSAAHRARPVPSHMAYEVYERVLVREANGAEYYIERPVRRGPEHVYIRCEDEDPRYRESTAYRGFEHHDGRLDLSYESSLLQDGFAGRRPVIEPASMGPEGSQQQGVYSNAPREAVEFHEEYDPRFPAAPSSVGRPRHARYQ